VQSVLGSKTLSTAEINNIGEFKIATLPTECFAMKHPRGSRSATCARKSTVRKLFSLQRKKLDKILNIRCI